MLNNLAIQNIRFYNNNLPVNRKVTANVPVKSAVSVPNGEEKLLNTLNCMSSVSFGAIHFNTGKSKELLLKKFEKFITPEIPVNFDEYKFLMDNPRGYYLQYGREVNTFLRTGTLKKVSDVPDFFSDFMKRILTEKIAENKASNRTIIESIDKIDSLIDSKTTKPMTVYRDAPKSWMDTYKDGFLYDAGFCSTSTMRGASMEGIISNGSNNFTYEIILPKGTPFADFTNTSEREMLLPRGCRFKVLSYGVLELVL